MQEMYNFIYEGKAKSNERLEKISKHLPAKIEQDPSITQLKGPSRKINRQRSQKKQID